MPTTTGHQVTCDLLKPFGDAACSIFDITIPNAKSTSYYSAKDQGNLRVYCEKDPEETGDLIITYLVNDTPEGYKTLKAALELIVDTIRTTKDSKVPATYVRESPDGNGKVTEEVNMDQCVVKSAGINFNHLKGVAITLTIHGVLTQ